MKSENIGKENKESLGTEKEREQLTIEELREIGHKIGKTVEVIKAIIEAEAPTEQEEQDFKEYISTMDAIGPITKPEFFMYEKGFEKIDRVKKRVHLVREIKRLLREC